MITHPGFLFFSFKLLSLLHTLSQKYFVHVCFMSLEVCTALISGYDTGVTEFQCASLYSNIGRPGTLQRGEHRAGLYSILKW